MNFLRKTASLPLILLFVFFPLLSAAATGAANGQNYSETYAYDAIGNITAKNGVAYTYAGTAKTNPHAVTGIGSVNYTYDDNGNLLSDGTLTNAWDYDNRLIQSVAGARTVNYAYDAEGQRVKKTTVEGATIYASKYYEISPAGKITKYIYSGDDNIAIVETENSIVKSYYTHKDHLGGSSVITDQTGIVSEVLDYYPYGGTRLDEKTGSFEASKKYTGKELDEETGLYYYGARYYNPTIGRFVSQDPAYLAMGDRNAIKSKTGQNLESYLSDPQNFNSYSYARNNPLVYIDETGEFAFLAPAIYAIGAAALMYAPQITSFAQSFTTPLGQIGMVHALDNTKQGNYGLAAIGAVTAGELPALFAPKILPLLDRGAEGVSKAINLNGPINITSKGLDHVINNHTLEGVNSARKSVFNEGENIANLIRQGTQQPMRMQPNRNYQRIFDVGRNVGLDRAAGEQTSKMTIITNRFGDLITAHPGLPKFLTK